MHVMCIIHILARPVLDLDRTGMDWTGFRLICFGLD
jgi:hypothetical protein